MLLRTGIPSVFVTVSVARKLSLWKHTRPTVTKNLFVLLATHVQCKLFNPVNYTGSRLLNLSGTQKEHLASRRKWQVVS